MDWIIWLVVIVVIVAVIWWRLNRNARNGTGSSSAAETGEHAGAGRDTETGGAGTAPAATDGRGSAALPGAGTSAAPLSATGTSAAPAAETAAAPAAEVRTAAATGRPEVPAVPQPSATEEPRPEPQDVEGAGWETHWSETPPQEPHAAGAHEPASAGHAAADGTPIARQAHSPAQALAREAAPAAPVHHPEYTAPHAPTLPGAESAAAESSDRADVEGKTAADAREATAAAPHAQPSRPEPAVPSAVAAEVPGLPQAEAETLQTATSVAGPGTSAGHSPEPSGHLALDQPYGEGSAAPAADGSGPEDFTVKGDATSMTYYDETSPGYEETRAEVWFLSPAHAEAAGFRPPRRTRR